jgi:hypothetical protein
LVWIWKDIPSIMWTYRSRSRNSN